ncbi:LacI family DNA-binding transcriptional regulator [Lentilactobacillus parakefiri]|uniref:LacI family transcriptional regulator n=1 Tax=Lentilactobacillus parakefiri TaxID=152332 RepID=A0A269YGZ1_9LACO|nr:LacI family DNA-binding transcriptional regulator [Lentilactobacillus parakefiri]PAK84650.1 LacI family transcriptional regulator [Lentilactobacillus parakefiri]
MAATIKDIAKMAGVSPATVSRVLSNQREFYSEKTAKKVRDAAKQLGYQRNTSAVELVTRKSRVIAVLVSSTQTNFSNPILNGIQQQAEAHNLSVMIIFAGENKPEMQEKALQTVIERSVMGILLVAVDLDPTNNALLESANIPFIFISMTMKNANFPFISSNDFDIGYQAIKYLIKKGHTKIGFAGTDLNSFVGNLRFEGYRDAMRDNQLARKAEWVCGGHFTYEDGLKAMRQYGQKTELTAVIASSDLVGIGILNQANQYGIRVPGNLAILTVDGTQLCDIVRPRLSSVTQSFFEMGVKGMDMLVSESIKEFYSMYTPINIVERESV